jgi:hypothetical protein
VGKRWGTKFGRRFSARQPVYDVKPLEVIDCNAITTRRLVAWLLACLL